METKEITPAVQYLRQNGYKVRVTHSRYVKNLSDLHQERMLRRKGWGRSLSGKGGRTDILITTPEGKDLHGWSQCSVHDNFDRKVGTRIALERAFENGPNAGERLKALLTELEKLSFVFHVQTRGAESGKFYAYHDAKAQVDKLIQKYK